MLKKATPVFAAVAIGLVITVGCSKSSLDTASFVAAANPTNVHRVTSLYQLFTRSFRGRGPRNQKVFQEFISQLDPEYLKSIGVEPASLDQLFVSERDGQPLKIVYGGSRPIVQQATLNGGPESSSQIERQRVVVVRETAGFDGMVRVGFLGVRSGVEELPAAEAPDLE